MTHRRSDSGPACSGVATSRLTSGSSRVAIMRIPTALGCMLSGISVSLISNLFLSRLSDRNACAGAALQTSGSSTDVNKWRPQLPRGQMTPEPATHRGISRGLSKNAMGMKHIISFLLWFKVRGNIIIQCYKMINHASSRLHAGCGTNLVKSASTAPDQDYGTF